MASISPEELARGALARCLAGEAPGEAAIRELALGGTDALFRILAEGLADRFEPALCDVYADLMAAAVASVEPGVHAAELAARYRRVRAVRPCRAEPRLVVVLSRVTLGADVAVSSVLLDAVKRRFPRAEIRLAGPRKNWELFACDPRVGHVPVSYPGGGLRERLAAWRELSAALEGSEALVVDSDSRLTQLGLLPVCPEDRYHLFESRGYGGTSEEPLGALAARWAAETFGVEDARPSIAVPEPEERAGVAVSLGVGGNPAKRIPDPFEEGLLRLLGAEGDVIAIDRGAGGEEAARVERAVARSGVPRDRMRLWDGSFAGFASIIARARLYVGYDSAGQHVAAAAGVPLISIFAGFPAPRMFQRWRPRGQVIRVEDPDPARVLEQVRHAR